MSYVYQRSYRGPVQAVLLDWAGTTMDYGCMAPAVVFMQVFHRKNVNITMEHAREPMGAHKKVHIRAISKIPAVAKMWQEAHGRIPNAIPGKSRSANPRPPPRPPPRELGGYDPPNMPRVWAGIVVRQHGLL
jgi:hypothetical protein